MGGQFNSAVFKGSPEAVRKEFNSWVSEAEYESGHAGNYTGSISEKGRDGLQFPSLTPFKNRDQAEDWLQEHNEKWGPAQAVPFITNTKEASASVNKRKRLVEAEKKYREAYEKLEREFLSALTNIKSASKSCRHCTSKIVKKHLHPECQVCGGDMYSSTQRKRLAVAGKKANDAERELRHFEPKYVGGKGKAYVVGGWCSS
jgi:translation initiation factor 2 beta subunit (eIF-2beta)/eIF-5